MEVRSKEKATEIGGLFVCGPKTAFAAFPYLGDGASQMLPLLADRAQSECARSMRAVGSTCTHSAMIELEGEEERAPNKSNLPDFLRPYLPTSRKSPLIKSPAEVPPQDTQQEEAPAKREDL